MAAIGKMFKVDHRRSLANPHGEIDLLIGLDDQRLLLKEMDLWPEDTPNTFRPIYKSTFMKDLSLARTVLSDWASVKGALGGFGNSTSTDVHTTNMKSRYSPLHGFSFETQEIRIGQSANEIDLQMVQE